MINVLSLGGGLDSFTMLANGVRRGETIDVVVFVNVGAPGEPGEWPGTYRHIEEVVKPFCAMHGIEFVEINHENYPVRDAPSLFAWMWRRGQIPVAGPKRLCTTIAKVERFERWLSDRFPDQDVTVWIGFEAGEEARRDKDPNAGTGRAGKPGQARRINRFPLMEWGFCRCQCEALVRALGYPVPRKSACVFCPYGTRGDWQRFAVDMPEDFARVVELEERKPPTKNGFKLSIMAFDKRRKNGPPNMPLPQYIARPYTRQQEPCTVCGEIRATKETGCDYLPE